MQRLKMLFALLPLLVTQVPWASPSVQAAPPAPQLIAPGENAEFINPGFINFYWSRVNTATAYEIRFFTFKSAFGPINATFQTVEPRFSIILATNCVWYWTVRAKDTSGWGPESRNWVLYTWDGISPNPAGPGIPAGTGPGSVVPQPKPEPYNNPPVVSGPFGPTRLVGPRGTVATYNVAVSDDGNPRIPGKTTVTWRATLLSLPGIGGLGFPLPATVVITGSGTTARIAFSRSGRYRIEAIAFDGQKSTRGSIEVAVSIYGEPSIPL